MLSDSSCSGSSLTTKHGKCGNMPRAARVKTAFARLVQTGKIYSTILHKRPGFQMDLTNGTLLKSQIWGDFHSQTTCICLLLAACCFLYKDDCPANADQSTSRNYLMKQGADASVFRPFWRRKGCRLRRSHHSNAVQSVGAILPFGLHRHRAVHRWAVPLSMQRG